MQCKSISITNIIHKQRVTGESRTNILNELNKY